MSQYGMGDEATIDEVIEDVDTDKVIIYSWTLIIFIYLVFFFPLNWVWENLCMGNSNYYGVQYVGREHQLRGVCSDDEKGNNIIINRDELIAYFMYKNKNPKALWGMPSARGSISKVSPCYINTRSSSNVNKLFTIYSCYKHSLL